MPGRFLSAAERERLGRFPAEIKPEDLITYFTLSPTDFAEVDKRTGDHNRLGFALQLCALRFLGFVPAQLLTTPAGAVTYVALQLDVTPDALAAYGARKQTRTANLQEVQEYLGFRKAGADDLRALKAWLIERAMEHDRPTLLLQLACEKLLRERMVRPNAMRLERLVAAARSQARRETLRRLTPLLADDLKAKLDQMLAPETPGSRSQLAWLQQRAAANSPKAILATLEKLAFLKDLGVDQWDIASLSPNRMKFLAQLASRSTNQALQRAPDERRYPILIAFLHEALTEIIDEAIDQFDRCLADASARAGHDLNDFRSAVARSSNEKVVFFHKIGSVLLDANISDAELRQAIYQHVPPDVLRSAVEESERIMRPLDDNYFDFLETRYGYLRQFTPTFLDAFDFRSNLKLDPLRDAIDLLRRLNSEGRRTVPEDAPVSFVSAKWRPYVLDHNQRIDRHYYELCVLEELRGALRAGDLWLQGSRRYANPETYLIPKEQWTTLRTEVCRQVQAPESGADRLNERGAELEALLEQVDPLLAGDTGVRMDGRDLIVPQVEAD